MSEEEVNMSEKEVNMSRKGKNVTVSCVEGEDSAAALPHMTWQAGSTFPLKVSCVQYLIFLKRVRILVFACSELVVQAKHLAVFNALKYITLTPTRMRYCIQPVSCFTQVQRILFFPRVTCFELYLTLLQFNYMH
jgi:hypothetical protein